jgi:hypothetical protein
MEPTMTTRTAAATPTTLRAQATATATVPVLPAGVCCPLRSPRVRLMATPAPQPAPLSMTHTSIFAQWAAADRINAGGAALIREIEG